MADSAPQPVPISAAAVHASQIRLGVGIPLLAIGLGFYFLRMWLRMKPVWRISAEDYCISIGIVSQLPHSSVTPHQLTTPPNPGHRSR